MSHFIYTYETLVALEIQHPTNIPLENNVTFLPSQDTLQLFTDYKLLMKPTDAGFTITYRTSATFNESKDIEGNVLYTPNGSIDWLNTNTLDIQLDFFCIATKKFLKNTTWEHFGPRPKNDNETNLIFTYNLYSAIYDAPASAPDIDNNPIETNYSLENGDYNRQQVAQIRFRLTGHIPNSAHKINTIII